jgi:hypothetical protein
MENKAMRMLSVCALIVLSVFLMGCDGDSEEAPVTPAATNGAEAPTESAVEPSEPAANTEETTPTK